MGSIGFNSSGQFQVGGNVTNWGKNYIINGNFDRWDYATSQTSSGYGSDNRWTNSNTGSTKTHSQVACTDTEIALFNAAYFSRTAVTSVAGAGNRVFKVQCIENVTKLAGKTVTISFWAKADSNKNIAIEMYQNFGTGGTPSSPVVAIGSQLVALTTTWQKKTITVTLPSIVGKTLGTNGVHSSLTALAFWFDAGSDYNTRAASLGQQSGTFDIAQVQLEEGSVATAWSPYNGEFGGEVQACQRYYQEIYVTFRGLANSTAVYMSHQVPLFEPMRTIPTSLVITGVHEAYTNISAMNLFSSSNKSVRAEILPSMLAEYYALQKKITASAEL